MNINIQALKKEEWKRLEKKSVIYVGIYPSSVGNMLIAKTINGVLWVSFCGEEHLDPENIVRMISSKWQRAQLIYAKEKIEEEGTFIESFIKGEKIKKSLNLLPIGTPFQLRVWKTLMDIPRGKTCTYSEIAEKIMKPTAVRATATAIANNPISLLIPCHRVVPVIGGVGKYAWGAEKKQQLLEIEGAL